MRRVTLSLSVVLSLLWHGAAPAQTRKPSHCIALAEAAPGIEYVHLAGWHAPVPQDSVRIRYIAHAMFLISTAGGRHMVTDYTGFIGNTALIPDVVTMNHAHDSHWTPYPDPAIPHVLEGWQRQHHLDLGEVLVRNVTTDIRSPFGDGVERDGNSIFIFEVAGLCIGHLGHLHHEPTPAQYAAIGRLDVVMAAVDGGLTVDLPTMIRILKRLRSSIVIPMHWFSEATLNAFLAGMADGFEIVRPGRSALEVSLRELPARPVVFVLEPAYLRDDS
ncbi:L-ascorbate metabolism protein UlaG, beta-lactamase superfamily [Meinhardsimonia xiamenensis]|jgi:L-ascorbate metabolism protein UlaG (beta-lactamase superfamily)|uniref:L-ascorbate metabolism protein UlaG, beta-lactamase superfamily n=1 Tax=Meinhardsimonia xiamenensis TaxID=990712 RepID=A0A1G9CPI4_9RHOB|nr:MBL fold metallo-hydrolase [Meinhardsimonia xiamenensis]PRX38288.1 L-ascorbate metabolism protein UlaG (beta-lactamase superfamily) [Meinhardsimonia xiamenensis]SDK53610.1 L-ascorbate metabolism protein UlaG, beta-lactamase superfamily [Meinhardsimonia xiamenensis]